MEMLHNLLKIWLLLSEIQCLILGRLFNKIAAKYFPGVLPSCSIMGLPTYPARTGQTWGLLCCQAAPLGRNTAGSEQQMVTPNQTKQRWPFPAANPCGKGSARTSAAMLKWGRCHHHHPAAPATAGGVTASTTTLCLLQILHLFNHSFSKFINSFLARCVVRLLSAGGAVFSEVCEFSLSLAWQPGWINGSPLIQCHWTQQGQGRPQGPWACVWLINQRKLPWMWFSFYKRVAVKTGLVHINQLQQVRQLIKPSHQRREGR